MKKNYIIKIANLSVNYERWGQFLPALEDINLEILKHQWVMITGHNGSGKSTLLKVLAGIEKPTSGNVTISAFQNELEKKQFYSNVFYVSQDPLSGTAEELTLIENLQVADTKKRGLFFRSIFKQDLYFSLMNYFDLEIRKDQLLKYFSGGERQQIALLIAKLRNPRLLLLDEPFSSLDSNKAKSCMKLIEDMSNNGSTILQVSHDKDITLQYGHRTIEFNQGHILNDLTKA